MAARSLDKTYLRVLKHWDHGFESHSRHGFLRLFCPVLIVALERAGHPSRESYQLFTRFIISDLILNGNRPSSNARKTFIQLRSKRKQFTKSYDVQHQYYIFLFG
jgi:hypothetical protein